MKTYWLTNHLKNLHQDPRSFKMVEIKAGAYVFKNSFIRFPTFMKSVSLRDYRE